MRFYERQRKVEETVYEAIETIAEELNLNVPYYPEVYWTGNKLYFDSLYLAEKHRGEMEERQHTRNSWFLTRPEIIFIGRDHPITHSEEAAHFLHRVNARFTYCNKSRQDNIAIKILDEMLAFFCSKLIVRERGNPYFLHGNSPNGVDKKIFDNTDFLIYYQGYGLGERLFYAYTSGKCHKNYIRNIFFRNFQKKGQASKTYIELDKIL
ncbi:MAG: hypothetical protein AABW65_02115 [Nanoarchaeota archaeon]